MDFARLFWAYEVQDPYLSLCTDMELNIYLSRLAYILLDLIQCFIDICQ